MNESNDDGGESETNRTTEEGGGEGEPSRARRFANDDGLFRLIIAVDDRSFWDGKGGFEERSGEDTSSEKEVHGDRELTVSEETVETSLLEGLRMSLGPGQIGEMMGEDDEGGDTTETVDPVETVRSTDNDCWSGSRGRFGRTSECGRVGCEGSVRCSSSCECWIFLLVEVRIGTSVTLLSGSDFSDGHVSALVASLVVRVAPVVVECDSRRVIGHSIRRDVIGTDS